MRIIAGSFRGKKLCMPPENYTRPTSDRAREALFNILDSELRKKQMTWEDIVFMDVFAGSGAVGLEAASRGAKHVFLIENNRFVLPVLKANAAAFKDVSILAVDALMPTGRIEAPDIIFMDAPYGKNLWQDALIVFSRRNLIKPETQIIVETDNSLFELPPKPFQIKLERSYGRNRFLFFSSAL